MNKIARLTSSILLVIFLFITCSKDDPIIQHDLTVEVIPSEGGSVLPFSGKFDEGESITLTASPAPEYIFKNWSGGASGTGNPIKVLMTSDKNVTAVFEKKQYKLTVEIEGEGVVNETLTSSKSSNEYYSGSSVLLTAVPKEGWEFVEWSGDVLGVDNPITLKVDNEKNVKAKFQPILYNQIIGKWNVDNSNLLNSKNTSKVESKTNDKECIIYSIVFNSDGSFILSLNSGEIVGTYYFDSSNSIILNDNGRFDNIHIHNNTLNFHLNFNNLCSIDVTADEDDDFNEGDCVSFLNCNDGKVWLKENEEELSFFRLKNNLGNTWLEYYIFNSNWSCTEEEVTNQSSDYNIVLVENTPEQLSYLLNSTTQENINYTLKIISADELLITYNIDGTNVVSELYELSTENRLNEYLNNYEACPERTYIPDNEFEQKLIDLGYDEILDDYVITSKINNIESLNFSISNNVLNLIGIEDFENLKSLIIENCLLEEINLTKNVNLEELILIGGNQKLQYIDLSKNTKLIDLSFQKLDFKELDITKNLSLVSLDLKYNQFEALDFSNNLNLKNLNIGHNMLTSLDITKNINIKSIDVNFNSLKSLDISKSTSLESLNISNNQGFENLDVSNNSKLEQLWWDNNFKLTCIKVNEAQLGNIPEGWINQEGITSFSLDCFAYYNDTDGDGVIDINDLCPNTPSEENVNSQGCSISQIDTDGDGVMDDIDVCPNTEVGESVNATGCSESQLDDDKDGVMNPDDLCPNTPSEESVNSQGCSISQIDTDGDGVMDNVDDCPNTVLGEKVNEYGCSIANLTYVPDDNFEQYLIDSGYDDVLDNYVVTANILNVDKIEYHAQFKDDKDKIKDFTGIEDFDNLKRLSCSYNLIEELDLSSNSKLTFLASDGNLISRLNISNNEFLSSLSVQWNKLTELDVTANRNLEILACDGNQLTNLDVSNNHFLKALYCQNNLLTNIDVSTNTELTSLGLENNKIATISLNKNLKLTTLSIGRNQLSTLDLQYNTLLSTLYCSDNQLTSLNVDSFLNLKYLGCENNKLSILNVSSNTLLETFNCRYNELTSLDVSNNTELTSLHCNGNQMSCVKLTQNQIDTYGNDWKKDISAIWSTSCEPQIDTDGDGIMDNADNCPNTTAGESVNEYGCSDSQLTYIPDDNFEQALIDLGYDSGPLDDYILTSTAKSITYLDVRSKNINDLTGIEDFENIKVLFCYGNNLTKLDVSKNIQLVELGCASNPLGELDISKNVKLETLICYLNNLSILDISNNTSLIKLDCGRNNLTSIDVSNNLDLEEFQCDTNDLTSLDVSNNPKLTYINCLKNNITNLNLTNNPSLTTLACGTNKLNSINLTNNTFLKWIDIRNNNISTLNLTTNINLEDLYCPNLNITSLDLSANVKLKNLYCGLNKLTSLNVKNGNNANFIWFKIDGNPDLNCVTVDNAEWSTINWTNIDSHTSFSEDCAATN